MDQYLLGWSDEWDHWLSDATKSAVRITAKHKSVYEGQNFDGQQIKCYPSGRMLHSTKMSEGLPAVGDWCLVGCNFKDKSNNAAAMIERIIPRRSALIRMASSPLADPQVLAANVDYAFVVTSANLDFNINRLRRYILIAEHGNVVPVIVLSKIDLSEDLGRRCLAALYKNFPYCEIIATSVLQGAGTDQIRALLCKGKSGVFLGSSGVGKSTLVNTLAGAGMQQTRAIRDCDDKGMHTTTASGLFFIPDGGMIIDTPGLRQVGVLGDQSELDRVMPGVPEFAEQCKFADCSHCNEPGCAVQSALIRGDLEEGEYDSYVRMQKEIAYSRRKLDVREAREERQRWKKITQENRRRYNERQRS